MSYGYQDYGYGSYGYGYSYGAYGYSFPYGPGGNLDATAYLDGPGSTAYLHEGSYTSYASEGYNGSIFRRQMTTGPNGYTQTTSYSYSNNDELYAHNTSTTIFNPPSQSYEFGSYGYGRGGTARLYSGTYIEKSYQGGYEHYGFQSLGEVDYANGYYRKTYSSTSDAFENGVEVPGAHSLYFVSSYGYVSTYS